MGIVGSAIGSGLKIAGSIFGGISASKAMKNVKNNLNSQATKNQNWYDRRYNEVATQRADALAAMDNVEKSIRERNRQVAGAQAVMGGTEESVAAAKEANAKALVETASNIAVNGGRRKDMIESQYQAKDEAIQQQLNDMEKWKAGQISSAVSGVAEAGSNIAGLF